MNKDESMCRATWGFDALGAVGKPAIPKLQSLMVKYPGYVPSALTGIGRDAMPDLLVSLTNENFWVRDNTAAAIANAIFEGKISATEAGATFPIALDSLSYENTDKIYEANTRSRAVCLLAALRMSPDISVPALIKELDYTNENIVKNSAWALSEFGQQARPAIPALMKAAGWTNGQISAYATRALDTIQKAR